MCELPKVQEPTTVAHPQVQQPKKETPAETAKRLGVTEARYIAMINYARQLKRNNPKMKEARIRSKVAEYFKIKLV
jgi:hypothetical protein